MLERTSQAVNIDTRFRKNYYKTKSSDFSVTLSEPQKKVVSMRLAALELPTTWFAISRHQQNNVFLIIAEDSTPAVSIPAGAQLAWLVTIPDGNYEQWWMDNAGTVSITQTINNSIALSQPGYVEENGSIHDRMIVLIS